MANYSKTVQAFNSEPIKHPNVRYEKPPEQKGHEAWLQKVTNAQTFFQITDLPKMRRYALRSYRVVHNLVLRWFSTQHRRHIQM